MNLVCPLCLKEDYLFLTLGGIVCKVYDRSFERGYLEIWNSGYRAGKGNPDTYANQKTYK